MIYTIDYTRHMQSAIHNVYKICYIWCCNIERISLVSHRLEYGLYKLKSSLPREVLFKGQNREALNDQGSLKLKVH